MADVTAMDDVVHDASAYARNAILAGLPPHAQSRYRQFGERKAEAEALLRHLIERDQEMTQRLTVAAHNIVASRQNGASIPTRNAPSPCWKPSTTSFRVVAAR